MSGSSNKKTLTSKIRIYMVFIGMASILIYFILSIFMYVSSYSRIENADLQKDATRTLEMMELKAMDLQRIAKDYGLWDEASQRLRNKDVKWFSDNYSKWIPEQQNIHLVVVVAKNGQLIDRYGANSQVLESLMQNDIVKKALKGDFDRAKTFPHGLFYVNDRYYHMAIAPIVKMSLEEPSEGIVILARVLDREQLLSVRMSLNSEIALVHNQAIKSSTMAGKALDKSFLESSNPEIKPDRVSVFNQRIFISKTLIDLSGNPVGRLVFTGDNEGYQSILIHLILAGIAVLIGITGVVFILSGSLAYTITKPLKQLRQQIVEIGNSTVLGKVTVNGTTEIEAIAEAFNEMSDNLYKVAQENEKYKNPQIVDGLTGLFNQSYLYQYLDSHLKHYGRSLHLFFVDVDFFAKINANYGNQSSDRVLQRIAEILRTEVMDLGIACRYEGEAFVAVVNQGDVALSFELAEKIRNRVFADEIIRVVCGNIPVSVSIGVVTYPEHGRDAAVLIDKSKKALEMAKISGRNTSWLYNPDDQVEGVRKISEAVHRDALMDALLQLVYVVDNKENYYTRHSEKVAAYADQMGQRLLETDRERYALNLAAMLHDCGKITIPERIIEKPETLTFEEFELVRKHPDMGYNLIQYSVDSPEILEGVRHHHERWDGKGYPDALMGEEIPLFARIIAVADAYQSIISDRPYRAAKLPEEAIAEMIENKGKQFDPELVDLFLNILEEEKAQEIH